MGCRADILGGKHPHLAVKGLRQRLSNTTAEKTAALREHHIVHTLKIKSYKIPHETQVRSHPEYVPSS